MITVFYRRKSPKQEVGRAETCVGDRRRLCDGTGQTNPFSATIRTQVTHSGVLSSFFLVAERRWGFEPHELRSLTTLRVLLTFLHKLCSHSSIKTALKLQKRSGIHSAYTVAEYCVIHRVRPMNSKRDFRPHESLRRNLMVTLPRWKIPHPC